ncbi:polymorphic toxin-type HINT domain-containing protein [Nocardiopsis sediminis]|uniref:Polymorphic toxin-type HINT domain-containing protein n=1 Tax=Nocardiopsis sediminis TaxID=1778267 RepID=A0ABV8FTH5_9ACTN
MLRRIHDPERGAGFVEYGAVILLVAAIAAVVLTAGIPGRVNGLIEGALDSVSAEGDDGVEAAGEGDEEAAEGVQDTGPDPGSEDTGFTPAFNNGDGLGVTPAGFTSALPGGSMPDLDFTQGLRDLADEAAGIGSRAGDVVVQRGEDAVNGAVDLFTTPVNETAANMVNGIAADIQEDVAQSWATHGEAWNNGDWLGAGAGLAWDAATYAYLDAPGAQSLPALLANDDRREQYADGQWTEAITESFLDVGLSAMPGIKIPLPRGLPDIPNVRTDPDAPNLADGPPQRPDTDTDRDGNNQDRDEDNDRDGTACPTGNSFVPGTGVLLADGTSVPIEDVVVGDEVLAFDPLTGEEGPREVTDTITGDGLKTLVTLTIDSGDGTTDTITATDEHPFWAPKAAEWVDAIDLQPGTWLRTSTGTWAQITSVEVDTTRDQRVHNLTIANVRTYYVLAGARSLLVHNSNASCQVGPDTLQQTFASANTEAKLEHVIDPEKHGFGNLVEAAGGRSEAMRMIVNSLGDAADLPQSGRFEVSRIIEGEQVTIRGAMVNGVPRIGTAFIPSAFPERGN